MNASPELADALRARGFQISRDRFVIGVQNHDHVGNRPRGIAWETLNEDILVCNEIENSVSVLSAANLEVRKVVSSQLNLPFDVAITPRQLCWGYQRNVYFAYILNRNGQVAVFERGPEMGREAAFGWKRCM